MPSYSASAARNMIPSPVICVLSEVLVRVLQDDTRLYLFHTDRRRGLARARGRWRPAWCCDRYS